MTAWGSALYAYNGTVSTFSKSIHYRDVCRWRVWRTVWKNSLTGFLNFLSKTSTMQPRKNAPPPSFSSKKRDVTKGSWQGISCGYYKHDLWLLSYEKKRNRNKRAVQLSIYWFHMLYMLVTPLLEKKYQYNNKSSRTNDNGIYCTKGCAVTVPTGPCHLPIAPRGLENPWIYLRVYGFRLLGFLQFFLKNRLGSCIKQEMSTYSVDIIFSLTIFSVSECSFFEASSAWNERKISKLNRTANCCCHNITTS